MINFALGRSLAQPNTNAWHIQRGKFSPSTRSSPSPKPRNSPNSCKSASPKRSARNNNIKSTSRSKQDDGDVLLFSDERERDKFELHADMDASEIHQTLQENLTKARHELREKQHDVKRMGGVGSPNVRQILLTPKTNLMNIANSASKAANAENLKVREAAIAGSNYESSNIYSSTNQYVDQIDSDEELIPEGSPRLKKTIFEKNLKVDKTFKIASKFKIVVEILSKIEHFSSLEIPKNLV